MRVLIAEDNKLVRRDFVGLLAADKEFEVCGEASDSSETLKKVAELRPDLILLDVSMPGTNPPEHRADFETTISCPQDSHHQSARF